LIKSISLANESALWGLQTNYITAVVLVSVTSVVAMSHPMFVRESEKIHIALSFDQGYVIPFYVLLTSILLNNTPVDVVLHVIATGLAESELQEIEGFVKQQGAAIQFYSLGDVDVTQFILPDDTYLSSAIYYRLFFPFLIPIGIKRLLYIDTDTLVVGNLKAAFELELGTYPVGAVTDTDMPLRTDLGINSTEEYFNSGVLLIDIQSWKAQCISERTLAIIQDQPERIKGYPDQDALNIVLHHNWYKLPTGYNLMRLYVPNEVPRRQFKEFLRNQYIIHYNGKKPWYSDCEHRLRHVFQEYQRLSPMAAITRIMPVKLSKQKRQQLRRSRLIEFYFDHPELMAIWRRLKGRVN
jgi:lipopolysaccharide biosynthesis glycosyltransferase